MGCGGGEREKKRAVTFSNPPDFKAARQLSMNSPGNLSLGNSPTVLPYNYNSGITFLFFNEYNNTELATASDLLAVETF